LTGRNAAWIGPVCSVLGVLGFSFKAILIKLAYAWHPVDAVTLLALRMLFAEPLFVAMAWWAGRQADARPIATRDWRWLVWLGFTRYYLSSPLDFVGLMYITAALERLVLYLYPTIVLVLSIALHGRRVVPREIVALAVSYAGIALVFAHDLHFGGDARCGPEARWYSRVRSLTRSTWSAPAA
jgi:drug/metabolite transporter (DMT)-like permease